jgi:D-methionine transport system ATP-binding protein
MSEPIIETRNLCKSWGDVTVLDNINISVQPGEIFGIIGKSGAGKSTLARCFNLLERPTSGQIFFAGKEITAMKSKELYKTRQSVGMIFQQFNLMMQKNVLDNVSFSMKIAGTFDGNRKKIKERAYELLELVGLSDKALSYPAKLSGGQKQRVAIARAIATNPKVLVCDEATSALDPETTRDILSLIDGINKKFGITVLIITHEMQIVETVCHYVAVISESRIAESGSASEIFDNPQTEATKSLIGSDSTGAARVVRLLAQHNVTIEEVLDNISTVRKIGEVNNE